MGLTQYMVDHEALYTCCHVGRQGEMLHLDHNRELMCEPSGASLLSRAIGQVLLPPIRIEPSG